MEAKFNYDIPLHSTTEGLHILSRRWSQQVVFITYTLLILLEWIHLVIHKNYQLSTRIPTEVSLFVDPVHEIK